MLLKPLWEDWKGTQKDWNPDRTLISIGTDRLLRCRRVEQRHQHRVELHQEWVIQLTCWGAEQSRQCRAKFYFQCRHRTLSENDSGRNRRILRNQGLSGSGESGYNGLRYTLVWATLCPPIAFMHFSQGQAKSPATPGSSDRQWIMSVMKNLSRVIGTWVFWESITSGWAKLLTRTTYPTAYHMINGRETLSAWWQQIWCPRLRMVPCIIASALRRK